MWGACSGSGKGPPLGVLWEVTSQGQLGSPGSLDGRLVRSRQCGMEDRQASQTRGSPPIRKEVLPDPSVSKGRRSTKMPGEPVPCQGLVLPLLPVTDGPGDSPWPNLCEQCSVDSRVSSLVGQVSRAWEAGRPALLWKGLWWVCGGLPSAPCPPTSPRPRAGPEPDVWPEAPACPVGNVSCSPVTPKPKGLQAISSAHVSV